MKRINTKFQAEIQKKILYSKHHSKIPLYKAMHSSDLLILNYFSVIIFFSFNFSKYTMAQHQQQRKAKDSYAHSYAIYPIFFLILLNYHLKLYFIVLLGLRRLMMQRTLHWPTPISPSRAWRLPRNLWTGSPPLLSVRNDISSETCRALGRRA